MKNVFNSSPVSILITTILLLLSSCEKDQKSCVDCYNNIFRCKINGVEWKPYCEGDLVFGCNPFNIQYYDDIKYMEIGVSNSLNMSGMRFLCRNVNIDSINLFEVFEYSSSLSPTTCNKFSQDSSSSNLKLIEINTSKRIIKASFKALLRNSCNDSLLIKDGYIDLRF